MVRKYQIGNMQCVLFYLSLIYILHTNIVYAQTVNYVNNNSKGNIIADRVIQDEHQETFSTEIPLLNDEWESTTNLNEVNKTGTYRMNLTTKERDLPLISQRGTFEQLGACPDIPMCTYNTTQAMGFGSCCQTCSCNVTTCVNEGNCCVDIIDDTYFDVNKYISVYSKQCSAFMLMLLDLQHSYNGNAIWSCESYFNTTNARLCNQTNTQSIGLQDLSLIYDKKTLIVYRNKYCAYCRGLSENKFAYVDQLLKCNNISSLTKNNTCQIRFTYVYAETRCSEKTGCFGFSGLFTVRERNTFSGLTTVRERNTQNDVFCGEKKKLLNGRCISPVESYTNIGIRIPLRMFPLEPLDKSKIQSHVNIILKTIINLIDQALKNICIDKVIWNVRTHRWNIEDIHSSMNVSHMENTSLDILFDVVANGMINANITNIFMSLFQNKNVSICLECMSANNIKTEENTDIYIYTLKYDSDLHLRTPTYDNGTYLENGGTLVDKCYTPGDELSVFDHFECPLIAFSLHDISWKKSFDGKLLIMQTISLDTDQYYFRDQETVVVCNEMYINSIAPLYLAQSTYSYELIISLVCISLSLLALAVSLIIYVLVGQHKKGIPGINIMLLMCSLLLAQTLYLVSSVGNVPRTSASCVVLGIMLHYAWLLVIFEMNVCTYHMYYVLAVTRIIAGAGRKRCFKYQLYALLSSALWVCVQVILSQVINNDIGYGKANCYINEQTMVYIAVGIPVAFVIVTNVVMFVKVVINIRQSHRIQRHVANDRNEIGIFVKLSTLTGLTWVFGLIDSVVVLTTFAYLFTIFNASQGVFLFVSFVCNRRVLIDLKKQFNLSSDRTVTSSNSGNPKSKIQSNRTNATTL